MEAAVGYISPAKLLTIVANRNVNLRVYPVTSPYSEAKADSYDECDDEKPDTNIDSHVSDANLRGRRRVSK